MADVNNKKYYVYYNLTEKHIKIHKDDCSDANPPRKTKNGEWAGPFNTYQDAKNAAENIAKRENIDLSAHKGLNCNHCHPEV